ncbi:hypothetical protein NP590_06050 [Methylomonas sp. SURF-2]|uniref:Fido domain-containing protein n=1 Tax=Methylomonas subterranea TaxID=2952225 RepID=A0ABT1TED7_9GAMM|nr:Fic family protein [Methylomonas sp. SURF-2]MCQ8103659.1 hypothetical protein [Methylomonas sp. SURF-2]
MAQLFFISKILALTIHRQQIERFGGTQGIRDEALLESELGAAQQIWHYSGDIFQTAAQYCHSLANNHPFWMATREPPQPVCWYFWPPIINSRQWTIPSFTTG